MDDLLREAIADAKAVRETALANAKIALEEAFTPRLQSMLSKKIASEMEDKDEEEAEEMREGEHEQGEHEEGEHEEGMHDAEEMDAEEMRDADEMDAEEMDAEEMRDADEMDAEEMRDSEEEMEEMRDADEEEMDESEDKEEMEDKDEKEMSEMEDKDEEEKMDEMEDKDEDDEMDEELDLESVLAELEKDLDDEEKMDEEYNENEVEDGMDKDEVEVDDEKLAENDVSSDIGKGDNKLAPTAGDTSKVGQGPESEGSDKKAGDELSDHETVDDLVEGEDKEEGEHEEDLDLDEVLRALTEEEAEENDAEENEKLKAEIKEHRKVINFMRGKLNEVNLLNAKLLFSNKLFRAFGLNNNQKLKVVETFDRTKNLREVKLVYATLAESFKRPGKRISESVKKGSASKPVRSTKPKAVLSEGQELKARFKKLANIL